MLKNANKKIIDSIIESHGYDKSKVIAIMQDIQKEFRYLPEESLVYLAEKLGLSEAKVYAKPRFTAWLHFMKTFLLSQRENIS